MALTGAERKARSRAKEKNAAEAEEAKKEKVWRSPSTGASKAKYRQGWKEAKYQHAVGALVRRPRHCTDATSLCPFRLTGPNSCPCQTVEILSSPLSTTTTFFQHENGMAT
jgi:hypothetical protein